MAHINFSDTVEIITYGRDFAQIDPKIWKKLSDNQKKQIKNASKDKAKDLLKQWGFTTDNNSGRGEGKDKGKGGNNSSKKPPFDVTTLVDNTKDEPYDPYKVGISEKELQDLKNSRATAWANFYNADKNWVTQGYVARTSGKGKYQNKWDELYYSDSTGRKIFKSSPEWNDFKKRFESQTAEDAAKREALKREYETQDDKFKKYSGSTIYSQEEVDALRKSEVERRTAKKSLEGKLDRKKGKAVGAALDATTAHYEADTKEEIFRGTKAEIEQGQEIRKDAIDAEKDKRELERQHEITEKGAGGAFISRASRNISGVGKGIDSKGGFLDAVGDVYEGIQSGFGRLDQRFYGKTDKDRKAGDKYRRKAENPSEIRVALGLNTKGYKQKQLQKAEDAEEKARTTRRAKDIQQKVKTAGDVGGAVLDTVSSSHRAQTLAERGTVGEKRRDARIAYAMGDRSFFTRLASGNMGGNNKVSRTLGKVASWATYGRRENKNRKNYAKQLAYTAGFSELGSQLASMSSHDFAEDNDTLIEKSSGEGWQYYEYPELAKLIDDQKYEEMDAKLIEDGEGNFSELDSLSSNSETPPDGRVIDSESLRPKRVEELTVNDLLNKNYYHVSPVEKKFQEMLARGFSEGNSNAYENFLQNFSDAADNVRSF